MGRDARQSDGARAFDLRRTRARVVRCVAPDDLAIKRESARAPLAGIR